MKEKVTDTYYCPLCEETVELGEMIEHILIELPDFMDKLFLKHPWGDTYARNILETMLLAENATFNADKPKPKRQYVQRPREVELVETETLVELNR